MEEGGGGAGGGHRAPLELGVKKDSGQNTS